MNVTAAPGRRRNPEKTEARRQQVLEAALSCFRKEGFRGASMADISAAATMSPGHIYHYFKNKEAIVEAIVDCDKQNVLEHIENLKGEANILDALVGGIGSRVHACETDHAAFAIEMFAEATRNPIVGAIIRDRDQILRQHLQEALVIGQRQGSVAADVDLTTATRFISALMHGIELSMALNPDADRSGLADAQRKSLIDLLAPR